MLHRLLFALCLLAFAPLAPAAAEATAKPNIIFIFADDLGIGNISAYGADTVKTPHIDRLATTGTRYTHAYTAPLCGPSRAIVMTGRYAFRTGATNQDRTGLMKPEDETMMPKILKTAGYVTSHVGKWGQLPLGPGEFGFDDYLRFKGSGIYWSTKEKPITYTVNGTDKKLKAKEYMPDLMHEHVVQFLTKHQNDPFYIYYCLSHIHGEIERTPDSAPDSKDLYADNVSYMDKLVGKLMTELDRLKLTEKTLVVFMGDNGTGKAWADRSTIGGKRVVGQKGTMQEGGALVPMIASWPGKLPAGKVSPQMIDSSDFVPTFAELAGAKLPAKQKLDGKSFATQLRGEKGPERDWIFIQLAKQWYVREARWKLTESGELLDMSHAPFEEKPVPATTPDPNAQAARKRLQAALDQLNPAGGILDDGDGTGRHAKRDKKEKKKAN